MVEVEEIASEGVGDERTGFGAHEGTGEVIPRGHFVGHELHMPVESTIGDRTQLEG